MSDRPELHQHDLHPPAARRLVADAGIVPGEVVLEVGAGTGNLSAELLAAGAKVHAIELDPRRAAVLRERFGEALAEGRLQLLIGDARHHLPLLPADWRVVANPPFMHTAELLRRWLVEVLPVPPPQRLDLVLQQQAARKLIGGRDKGHTRMSVLCHLGGRPRLSTSLAREDVAPPSHVPLTGFAWQRRRDAPEPAELARVDRLLERAFAGPKSVREALRGLATPAICKRQGEAIGWDPEGHPRHVPPLGWLELTRFLHGIGKLG
jgi:23S rRNA (adenine-N6)-dimethyltransferase